MGSYEVNQFTSIGFGVEPILGFLMEVEVEVEATFHHTKDTKW